MKNFFGSCALYAFILLIIALLIASLVVMGVNVFDFCSNAVERLGGGFLGVFLFIAIPTGVCFAIYGMLHPPQLLEDSFENAPEIIKKIIAIIMYLIIMGLIVAFTSLGF